MGGCQLLAIGDELPDEIGLLAGKTVRDEDGLRRLAELRELCCFLGSTLLAQASLEPLALGHELLGLDRVELLESVRGHGYVPTGSRRSIVATAP